MILTKLTYFPSIPLFAFLINAGEDGIFQSDENPTGKLMFYDNYLSGSTEPQYFESEIVWGGWLDVNDFNGDGFYDILVTANNSHEVSKVTNEQFENIPFETLNEMKMVAQIKNLIGYNYSILTEGDKAIDYYFKSLMLCRELNDKPGVAYNYIDIGNLYYDNENYNFAEKYYNDALDIYLNLKDTLGISATYTNIANAITDSDVTSNAVQYYFKSIELQEFLEDTEGIATNYNNIGD